MGGFRGEQVGVDRGVFGQRTLHPSDTAGEIEDSISDREAGHACTHRFHDVRQVHADNGRNG